MSQRSAFGVVVALSFACSAEDTPPLERQSLAVSAPLSALPAPSAFQPSTLSVPALRLLAQQGLAELDQLRDPFEPERVAAVPPIEREGVAFADSPVRSLKVSGTVDGVGDGKAIVAGADGETRVLSVGARIGQLEKTPDGVNGQWRIDSVRDGRVYLLRDGGAMQAAIVLGEPLQSSGRKRSASRLSDRPSRR